MDRFGGVAEWLGRGLQNLVRQFNSARRLPGLLNRGSGPPTPTAARPISGLFVLKGVNTALI